MRLFVLFVGCATLLHCTAPSQPLDGVWRLVAAHFPLDPYTLTLTQHDGTVTGTGDATGVDRPIAVTVSGTVSLPAVSLTFSYGGGTARYTATLQSDSLLVGQAVYDATFGGLADSLMFARQ